MNMSTPIRFYLCRGDESNPVTDRPAEEWLEDVLLIEIKDVESYQVVREMSIYDLKMDMDNNEANALVRWKIPAGLLNGKNKDFHFEVDKQGQMNVHYSYEVVRYYVSFADFAEMAAWLEDLDISGSTPSFKYDLGEWLLIIPN